MAQIEDIRVNGQQSSLTTTPTIAGLHPVFSWDFAEDEAAIAQNTYFVRVGTSAVNLGTSDFSGDKLSTSAATGSNFFEYTSHNLDRNDTYYGQVKTADTDGDETPWSIFTFKTNNLPFVSNFSLSPITPEISDDIELSYTYGDLDNHDESGTKIRWLKNNLPVTEFDDLCILPSRATSSGESWTAKIAPSDGLEFGAIVETSAVTISGVQSSFATITILPTDANVDDIFKAEWSLIETEYIALTGVVSLEWFINDVAVPNSNNQFMRLNVDPGDLVSVSLALNDTAGGGVLAEASSVATAVAGVDWHLFNVTINELRAAINIADLTPVVEWNIFKSTAIQDEIPNFFRLMITKTPSRSGTIFDTGEIVYTNNSFTIPAGILSRGQNYFVHTGVSDNLSIPDENFARTELDTAGSSWEQNVSNTTGWTIETKVQIVCVNDADRSTGVECWTTLIDPNTGAPPKGLDETTGLPVDLKLEPRVGVYIHDGTRFCSVTFSKRTITFHSDTTVTGQIPVDQPNLLNFKTFRISGKGNDVKVYVNNVLIIDATGKFTNASNLKFIEYGDIDGKYTSEAIFGFFRFTTTGASGISATIPNENVFHFFDVGQLDGGTIEYIETDTISWLPDDTDESSKLLKFNANSAEVQLATVTKNFSPITVIHVDKNRNKYIGTPNGLNAIFGEKHDPDYELITSSTDVVITTEDFDRITSVDIGQIALVEPDNKSGWFTIDTTFRTIGVVDPNLGFFSGDPYDPYKFGINSNAIHYYSQRTHGHSWYDQVDNATGWQLSFSFQLERLEQEDFVDQNIDHMGFGIYVNDGTYQEILYFYQDRIRLFYANVFVPVVTTSARNYRVVAKDKNIFIYQKLDNPAITSYQLLINGTGLFVTPSAPSGNSHKPRVAFDTAGDYHSVWHDDGNGRSQIFYSTFNGSEWSNPELIVDTQFNIRNPSVAADNSGKIWVAYEDTSWGQTEISVAVRDSVGWNTPTRITNARSTKRNPDIAIDSFENVHVVWEDDRNGGSQIFWAQREKSSESWISSGQFGEDTAVIQQRDNDPYGAINAKHPKLAFDHPTLWLVSEIHEEGGDSKHTSAIYLSSRDIVNENWQSRGVPIFNSDNEFLAYGTSILVSPSDRNCVKPSIAINDAKGSMVVVWEDQTEPINQIWGASFNSFGTEIVAATQITSRVASAIDPTVGFVFDQAAILFESDGVIYLANYDSNFRIFHGTALGDVDEIILTTTNRQATHPSLPQFVSTKTVKIVYDFLREKDLTLESIEFPDYYLIGDATVSHAVGYPSDIIATSTLSDGIVSNLDTKEFAFGDMSETTSMTAHWKDIQIYYGYDAKPLSIAKFNSSSVFGWGDDRINDVFVDTFGNLILAKLDGLFYHNVFTGELTKIDGHTAEFSGECADGTCLLKNEVITAVKWGGNGAWFVGTTTGLFLSTTAGENWTKFVASGVLPDPIVINRIVIDSKGRAICATNLGIVIAPPVSTGTIEVITVANNVSQLTSDNFIAIGVDDNDVIWAGGEEGLVRIESKINFLFFNKKNGMRASHVSDISIVNKHLRYIATANGVDKMNGTTFSSISTQSHDILNNNIAQVYWVEETKSLWIASLHSLHEIVFRDTAHNIIQDEIVQYDSSELLTDSSFETTTYNVLDIQELQQGKTMLEISPESATVLINKNKIDFGFTVGELGEAITFLTPMLPSDEVEILVSSRFIQFHDFNQTEIEKSTIGEKRTSVTKIVKTLEQNQTLIISATDKNDILLLNESQALPFTTVLLDRELPKACLQQTGTLTPTQLKFKVLAFDEDSGIDGYMLSNFENFTSDGDTPLDFGALPNDGIVTHNIGADLNNVTTSLTFPTTTTIGLKTVSVGPGSHLGKWTDRTGIIGEANTTYLFATTDFPAIVWRFDPAAEEWTAISELPLDNGEDVFVTDMFEMNNVLYITTGTIKFQAGGQAFQTINGSTFTSTTTTDSTQFTTVSATLDGLLYFGDARGFLQQKKGDVSSRFPDDSTSFGNVINSIDIWNNLLIAGTGNQGRIYLIDLQTESNLIVFVGAETAIDNVHIKDSQTVGGRATKILYASSNESTTIYQANLEDLSFIKSFNSFNKNISRMRTIDRDIFDPQNNETLVVASIGSGLFKHNDPAWEFFYQNTDVDLDAYDDSAINDFVQYGDDPKGIYIISNNKIMKWTNILNEKTVYVRVRDKAGNVSATPDLSTLCPPENDVSGNPLSDKDRLATKCCDRAYSLKIEDLKEFVNESRIVDITEDGDVVFTFDSPENKAVYSADEIDEEVGIFTSEVLNGSNDLVSWKTITWVSITPTGTSVDVQIRSGATSTETESAEWTADLIKNSEGRVSLEHITNQYIQFRVFLRSQVRDITPTLTSITLRNLTTQSSHFFTTNFIMPSRPIKGLLTANTFIPVTADVVFGINTKDSTDFGDYQIIEPNRLFTTVQGQFGENLRIGVKLLSPGVPQLNVADPDDPYAPDAFECTISFVFQNDDITYHDYHFRIRFYNDRFRTQLIHTFFSGNDQTGWSDGAVADNFPGEGLTIASGSSDTITFEPIDRVETNQRWYLTIEAWDETSFETISNDDSFICSACNITNEVNLVGEYYQTGLPNPISTMPDFSAFTFDHSVLENDITFPSITGTDWTTSKGQVLVGFTDNFAAKFRGKIQAPTVGTYGFRLTSSDGSILFIDGTEVVNHDGEHGFTVSDEGSIVLTEGFHDIEVHYFEIDGTAGLNLEWTTPGESAFVNVPQQRFFHAVANEYCDDTDSPKVFNFGILFELENGETVKINLTP